MNILILDSSYLTYKSYFAFQRSHLKAKIEDKEIITSAIFGYIREIIKLRNALRYDYIIAALDSPPYKKKQKYPTYKDNRQKNKIPDLKNEREIIEAILYNLNIPCLYSKGYEAEEVAKATKKKLKGHKMSLYTSDEDCYALLSKNFTLLTTKNSDIVETTKKDLFKKYGLKPKHFHLFKTLTGCLSDNVKGANGIGPKRASYIIAKSKKKTLDSIREHISDYPPSIQNLLEEAFKTNIFESSSFLTKIETPKLLLNKKPEVNLDFIDLLEFIDAKTLIKGRNKLTLKKLKNSQKRLGTEMKTLIGWKKEKNND